MICLRNFLLPAVWLAASMNWVSAQLSPVAASVQQFRNHGGRFEATGVFSPTSKRLESAIQFAPNAQFLTLDAVQVSERSDNLAEALTLQLPYQNEIITVDLLEVGILTADFTVITNQSADRPVEYIPGRHYRGVIRGDDRSVVAFSFLQSGISGLICDDHHGNLVLGKLEYSGNTSDYILYSDREVTAKPPFSCEALEHDAGKPNDPNASKPDVNGCVRVYFETDYELFQNKGSVQATVDYLAGAFNQLATLYANEQINTTLSQVYVWVSPDSYSTSSSSTALNQFKALRKSYNGDIAHLVSIGGNNLGGIAYVDILCVPSYAYAFSDINTSYNAVPTYSWTVEVLTHEMGHNLGSPHTQSCTWPGGAIDNCFTTEGGCAAGPAPVNGGTIMSYCHLTNYGINFNNGFGTLPGNKVRTEVGNATCLSGACTPLGSCLAPKSLTVSNITGSNATVSWVAVSGATGYNLQWRAVGSAAWTTVNNAGNPYNITGLPPSDEIEVQVQTVCGNGNSAYSYGVIFISSSGGGGGNPSCGTPGNLTASATSSTSGLASWSAVSGANSYQLSYKLSNATNWSNPVNLTSTSYTLTGLSAGSTYNVRVSATCSGVASNYATTTFTTTGGNGAACGAPGNLSATANSSSTANISWSAGSGASYYQLYYKTASSAYWSAAITVIGTTFALSGLAANTSYNVRVRTVCASGTSVFVNTTFTTPAAGGGGGGTSCTTPANFVLVNLGATWSIISWNTATGATGYDLQIKLASSSTWMTFLNLPTTVVQITNMQPSTSYQARVRSRCSSSNVSAWSPVLNINTPASATGTGTPLALTDGEGAILDLENTGQTDQNEFMIRIQPNPTTGWVTVYGDSETNETTRIEWFDLNGRLLSLKPAESTENGWQFDLGSYPPGVYFVRLYAGNQQPVVRRVVRG